ncbi:MAG: sigma-70 family RNA polymerase sigma factor [Planctomycetaceae bacterium]
MTSEPPQTQQWLIRLQQGETTALVDLFEFYRPRLRDMVCLRIGRQLAARLDPSDVLQEAYVDACRRVGGYVQDPKVSAYIWLWGLTRERLMKLQREHLGTQRRTALRELQLPDRSSLLLARRFLTDALSPSRQYRKQELCQQVQRAIDHLADEDRDIILMRHFEGMSNAQVAEALELSVSGARMRHGRALLRLKEQLVRYLSLGDSS